MKNVIAVIIGIVLFGFASISNAQFNKAVIVLKGTVTAEQTHKPFSVRVSVREAGNQALEITGSRSNSETGYYLVVLKPAKKYWVHFEGEGIVTKDELLETPAADKTLQIEKDYSVTLTQATAKATIQDDKKGVE